MFQPIGVVTDWVTLAASAKDCPNNLVGIYVGGTGNVVILNQKGQQVTFTAVPAGTFIPVQPRQIVSMTATGVLGALGLGK